MRRHEHFRAIHSSTVGTVLLTAAIALAGVVAFLQFPAPLPQVDFPTICVRASLPGASPEIMALRRRAPGASTAISPALNEITSASYLGQTGITLQFDLTRDIDGAAGDVQAAIDAARANLPANLPRQSELPQSESCRRAHYDPCAHVRHL